MENFTIHIFGYGETQINSKDLSVKVSTDTLTNVTPLIEGIFAKKPAENTTVITDFHAINLFGFTLVALTFLVGNTNPSLILLLY